jgi:hypothetical protein
LIILHSGTSLDCTKHTDIRYSLHCTAMFASCEAAVLTTHLVYRS